MNAEPELLRQEREVQELLASVPAEVVGSRLRRARERMGLSIRDLAKSANVSKTSIVRLDQGHSVQPITLLKLCSAMGIHVASIAKPTAEETQLVAIHRREDDSWYDLTDFGAGPIAKGPLTDAARAKLVKSKVRVPLNILASRLDNGKLLPTIIELYEPSERRSHAGEEMVFVLAGTARIDVGPESFVLKEGESATFWSSEEHAYAPAKGSDLPVRVLSIRIDDTQRKRK